MSESDSDQTENKLDIILKELLSFKKSTTKDLEENKKRNLQILAELSSLKKDLKSLKVELAEQKVKLAEQATKINTLEKKLLESTLNIPNVPHSEGENLLDLVYVIAQKSEVKLTTSSVVNVYRKNKKSNGNPGDIIVKFNSKITHDNLIIQTKKKNLKLDDIGFKNNKSKLYINHELSSEDKTLFFEARKKQKVQKWKYVWEKSGNIYLRKQDGGQVEIIKSLDQLKNLE